MIPVEMQAPVPGDLIQDAAERLSSYLGEEVQLLEVQSVVWNNSSLGCPESGYYYLQVLTPGYQFIFQHRKTLLYVHTDRLGQHFVLAENPPIHLTPNRNFPQNYSPNL